MVIHHEFRSTLVIDRFEQPVLDQWSALDTGRMATAVLHDGSTITATDDHQFWVNNQGAWVELDQLQPGDHLLGPAGITTIAAVAVAPPTQTLVWESPSTTTSW